MKQEIKASELRLADEVVLGFEGWNTAIVQQITEDSVTLFRPYGTTGDVSHTGGVSCYVGIEIFSIPRNDLPVTLLGRKDLL